VSAVIWEHAVLPASDSTHVNALDLNLSQTGWYSTYLPWSDERLRLS